MALASVLSAPPSIPVAPAVWDRNPARRAASVVPMRRAEPFEPRAIVHMIHPDEEVAMGVARSWQASGVGSQVYPDMDAFVGTEAAREPGCLIVHVPFAHADMLDLLVDHPGWSGELPMIVTADRVDLRTAVRAMKAGVIDFFQTPCDDRDLGAAVASAIRVDRARRDAEARTAGLRARFDTLTRREREVMALVTRGLLNKQVAGHLNLSEITVKVHRGSAMRKMEARTLADLVRMADMLDEGDLRVEP